MSRHLRGCRQPLIVVAFVAQVLFQMLTIFTVRSIVDYSFLKQFYAQEVANGQSRISP